MSVVKIDGGKQITKDDSRYYEFGGVYRPSVTHILHRCWPDNFGLVKWIGSVGNEEAARIRDQAGAVGTFVHEQIPKILHGGEEPIRGLDGFTEEMTTKAAWGVETFKRFVDAYDYEEELSEFPVVGDNYAGTADALGKITLPKTKDRLTVLADWKTSKYLRDEMRAQLVLYNEGKIVDKDGNIGTPVSILTDLLAIVHLGNDTKRGFTFSVVKEDKYAEYLNKAMACVNMFHTFWPEPTKEEVE